MRVVLVAVVIGLSACSQRSPWVQVPAPSSPRQSASAGSANATRNTDDDRVALASIARPRDAGDADLAALGSLHFPVAGMEGRHIADSFDDARDGGARRHNAIDIMAPRGTPVLAAQDGRVLRMSTSSRGGITLYATDIGEQFVFYYAHLDRYHPRMRAGLTLTRGDTLGFVGTTGNAPENVPHLHFQVMRMPSDRKYWNGEPINPYPLLREPASPSFQR